MSKWTDHVKAYAEKNKISYKEAMKAAKDSYEKGEKKESKMPEKKEIKEKKEKKEGKMKEKKEMHEKREKKDEYSKDMMHKAENVDSLKKKHGDKKRETDASTLKPKKMMQLQ